MWTVSFNLETWCNLNYFYLLPYRKATRTLAGRLYRPICWIRFLDSIILFETYQFTLCLLIRWSLKGGGGIKRGRSPSPPYLQTQPSHSPHTGSPYMHHPHHKQQHTSAYQTPPPPPPHSKYRRVHLNYFDSRTFSREFFTRMFEVARFYTKYCRLSKKNCTSYRRW